MRRSPSFKRPGSAEPGLLPEPEFAFSVTVVALTADVLLVRNEVGTHAHPVSFLLFAMLVLLPLNVLAVFLWAGVVFSIYRHYVPRPGRPCKVIEDNASIRVWLAFGAGPFGIRLIAAAMALGTAAVVGLVAALVIGLTFRSRPELPLTAVLAGWAVALGSAVVTFLGCPLRLGPVDRQAGEVARIASPPREPGAGGASDRANPLGRRRTNREEAPGPVRPGSGLRGSRRVVEMPAHLRVIRLRRSPTAGGLAP